MTVKVAATKPAAKTVVTATARAAATKAAAKVVAWVTATAKVAATKAAVIRAANCETAKDRPGNLRAIFVDLHSPSARFSTQIRHYGA